MFKFIENIGDYFASNYFDEDFVKKVLEKSAYSSEDIKDFIKLISPLKDSYYKYKNEYLTLKRPKDRIKLTHQFHSRLLTALKYNGDTTDYGELCLLNDKEGIPVRSKLYRGDRPHLFIMEMQALISEADNVVPGLFEQVYHREQWQYVFQITDPEITLSPSIINEALSELFLIEQERRPVYVLMLAGSEIYMIHYEKWFRGSYLRFSLEDLFDEASLKRDYYALFYLLLSKEALAPDSDIVLMEQLDEDSHKSAYAVTKDLKEGVIKAIEDLANEAVYYLTKENRLNTLDDTFANNLKDDCITLVYRLLFLFYAESRSELEILPANDQVYEKGYSLEMLRDLEQVPLQSESAKNGYFFHESLWHLFKLVGTGYNEGQASTKSFVVKHIDSPLFDDVRLKTLQDVKFRNFVWQDIICQLSLSQKQRGRTRGRISYVNLGINQLGSVYEGLLAYRGFFAEEDQIEVKRADDKTGKEGTYVVPRHRRGDFEEDEIVKDNENEEKDKVIPKGTFIYRLSGRDRQKTASYYTPEVLTHTTVKYTLKPILERLETKEIKADDLLNLKILEPAMGAAAFHNEVINQLSEAYLDWKQKERNKKVSPKNYREELQRVKAYIATHNVYGVDINPTAVELGKISLWLNVIHKDMQTPFFGYRLGVGNAVVGAWRKVYSIDDVNLKWTNKNRTQYERKEWWNKAPRQMPWKRKGSKRKDNEIYHFLLPDKNMVPSANIKLLKEEYSRKARAVVEWKKRFTMPLTNDELVTLQKISGYVDELFEEHYKLQKEINEQTHANIKVWGQIDQQHELFDYRDKEEFARKRTVANAPYYKLKMVMDYWCSLWFWDIREAEHLPTREEFISDIVNILDFDLEKALSQEDAAVEDVFDTAVEQTSLGFTTESQMRLKTYKSTDERRKVADVMARYTPQTSLFPDQRKELVAKYSARYLFFHYELEFVEVFSERGGFDVIVGNPPWVTVEFDESGVISDTIPEVIIRNFSSPQTSKLAKQEINKDKNLLTLYLNELLETENQKNFLGSYQIYPLINGQRNNIYKAILETAFILLSINGYLGILHPEGVYDDSSGINLREEVYQRLLFHFQFQNEFKLFSEIGNRKTYSINVYSGKPKNIHFYSINNLFHPNTVDGCFIKSSDEACEGIKIKLRGSNKYYWNTKSHHDRLICFTDRELLVLSKTFETDSNHSSTPLISIHSNKILSVLAKLNSFGTKLRDYNNKITDCWNETNAINDGSLLRKTTFPNYRNYEMVYSGPHFYVANPIYQTPLSVCNTHKAYETVDLTQIQIDFLPRTNYLPVKVDTGFKSHVLGLNKEIPWIDQYKVCFSRRLNQQGERTLQPSILPPKTSHINTVISVIFEDPNRLVELAALASSIVFDFYIKTLGRPDLYDFTLQKLPLGLPKIFYPSLAVRALLLNCLNQYYADIWKFHFKEQFKYDSWSKKDSRLKSFKYLSNQWHYDTPLRNFVNRRQALIEIDVITAIALGLSLEELLLIYKVQFPVLNENESNTYYDQKGNIVFTTNKSLSGIGLDRLQWETVKNNKSDEVVLHTVRKSELYFGKTITNHPPFEKCDRIADYKQAWAHFEKIFAEK